MKSQEYFISDTFKPNAKRFVNLRGYLIYRINIKYLNIIMIFYFSLYAITDCLVNFNRYVIVSGIKDHN